MIINTQNYGQYNSSLKNSVFHVAQTAMEGEKKLYLPQTRTMYLSGMKYRMTVNTEKATMASQLKNGTVQLKVLNKKINSKQKGHYQ